MDQCLVAWICHNSMGGASASYRSISTEGSVVTTVTASVGTFHCRAECVIPIIIILCVALYTCLFCFRLSHSSVLRRKCKSFYASDPYLNSLQVSQVQKDGYMDIQSLHLQELQVTISSQSVKCIKTNFTDSLLSENKKYKTWLKTFS